MPDINVNYKYSELAMFSFRNFLEFIYSKIFLHLTYKVYVQNDEFIFQNYTEIMIYFAKAFLSGFTFPLLSGFFAYSGIAI